MKKRTQDLNVRVFPEDKERIRTKMEEAGIQNMSAYIRKMALDGICVKLDLTDVRQLIVLLQRCSNNWNQYAKQANETGSIYAADSRICRAVLMRFGNCSDSPLLTLPISAEWQGDKSLAKGRGAFRVLHIPSIPAG